jgi:hypothetical protein
LSCTTGGFTFAGTNGIISVTDFISVLSAGTLLAYGTSVNDAISIRNGIAYSQPGTYIMSGLADSGNIASGKLGNCINVRLIGDGSFAETITEKDNLWEFLHNDGIPDSIVAILASHAGDLITIVGVDTPVMIDDQWTFSHESRMSGVVGGVITYGGKGAHVGISASITAIGVVPNSRSFTFLLYKNGNPIVGAEFVRSFSNAGQGNLSIVWQEDLATDDELSLWVENTETADDITIDSIQLGVQG